MSELKQPEAKGPNWYVLCLGLPPPTRPTYLAPGVTARPLPFKLTGLDLIAAAAMGFSEGYAIAHHAPHCTIEFESASDGASTPGFDTLNRVWLASSLFVLRGYWQCLCLAASNYSWTRLRERPQAESKDADDIKNIRLITNLQNYQATALDYRLRILSLPRPHPVEISTEDVEWIRDHYERFNQLCSTSDSFRFALMCCVDWRLQGEYRSALARLWQGIEGLLGIKMELNYRISMSAASILQPRGLLRIQECKNIRKLYGARSKAVHGDKISEDELARATEQSFDLLRCLINHCIDRGKPYTDEDLLELILG